MYRYETHLHTSPVSKCARATVRETLEFYKSMGYDGVFITNHFINGMIGKEEGRSYEDLINFFFSDYEEAIELSSEIGIKVFPGAEISYTGNHFLVYGLDKEWYLAHPESFEMKFSEMLGFMREEGAFIIHAHPFDERSFIDHIKLLPRCVDAVEVVNVGKTSFQNSMANLYADAYGLLKTAGSDNHSAGRRKNYAGIECPDPINSVSDFIAKAREGKLSLFKFERENEESEFVDVPIEFELKLTRFSAEATAQN